MSRSAHTYGPTCHLAPKATASRAADVIPDLDAQFFYSSADDPLSATPSFTDSKPGNYPPRPFSSTDNKALEEAWRNLLVMVQKDCIWGAEPTPGRTGISIQSTKQVVGDEAQKDTMDASGECCCEALEEAETGTREGCAACGSAGPPQRFVSAQQRRKQGGNHHDSSEGVAQEAGLDARSERPIAASTINVFNEVFHSMPSERPLKTQPKARGDNGQVSYAYKTLNRKASSINIRTCEAHAQLYQTAVEVPVGASKLHLVKMPDLQMQPIYWSPVNEPVKVLRATWFYKANMYPVEASVANQLERGYKELRAWSETWRDELNSALELDAAAEEKIAQNLWPKDEGSKSKGRPYDEAGCAFTNGPSYDAVHLGHYAAFEGNTEIAEKDHEHRVVAKKYANAQVIYKDAKEAFILKPNLAPSAYYGRKPLQKINKGLNVGISVTRGFSWKAWERLHPSEKPQVRSHTLSVSADINASKGSLCPACYEDEKRPEVTDLLLVIHGIGQKLSERIESFNFTHAINDFRRSINVDCSTQGMNNVLREGFGGIMTLPVNWRSNLKFEEGGLLHNAQQHEDKLDYSLADVTQGSLPVVRKMISDVMLDIPYYMSHHKSKMIQAVIQEANRVYRLWCKNNPDFVENGRGRVHIIAHSLGSAIALEVLSHQPTAIPKATLEGPDIIPSYFEFQTTNLFFIGSPAGFFLLLEQSKLVPRRGLAKPGAEGWDDKQITGEAGTFGCLAVDNIYNIMHYNDPIAYRLNPCVDRQYAESLKDAQVPSATTSIFGNILRGIFPGATTTTEVPIGQLAKPASVARLPSQLEMEVHDFDREEIGERKFQLLNDNGQVDWYLKSGRGPLEFQYLSMLSAHSSYWLHPDFVRFVVVEVGRREGSPLPNMKACKSARRNHNTM